MKRVREGGGGEKHFLNFSCVTLALLITILNKKGTAGPEGEKGCLEF